MKYCETGMAEVERRSPSLRRVWVEILWATFLAYGEAASPSLRRVWVEIVIIYFYYQKLYVTLLAEGVG